MAAQNTVNISTHTEQGCLVLKKVEVAFIRISGSRSLLRLQHSFPSCWDCAF